MQSITSDQALEMFLNYPNNPSDPKLGVICQERRKINSKSLKY